VRTPLSKHPSDLASVEIQRYLVGFLLKSIDPGETYFHVELFKDENYNHAEIWLTFEWKESLAKQYRFRARQEEDNKKRRDNNELQEVLSDALTAWKTEHGAHLPEVFCKKVAAQIVSNYEKHDLSALIKTFDLVEIMAKHAQPNQPIQK